MSLRCRVKKGRDVMLSAQRNRDSLFDSVMLIVLVALVYGRILGHDFQNSWDDNWYVLFEESAHGFSWEHLRTAFAKAITGTYTPVQQLSYMLDYTLWGLKAGGYLFSNMVIHTANGLLVYRLLMRWYGERLFALVASALFLIHPVQVESVAWISQRRNLLAMFFILLAWEGYCRYREASAVNGRVAYTLSVAAFVLALLAKPVAVIFPVALVLYDLCFPEGGCRLRLKDKIPFFLAAGIIVVVTMQTQGAVDGSRTDFHGGSPLATFFTMLPVFCRYLGMIVWPAGLSAAYAPPIHTSFDVAVAGAFLLMGAVVLAGSWLFRNDRRLGFWVIFFFLGLLPVSQIVPINTLMNDRYLYFPMLGVVALAGAGVVELRERLGAQRRSLMCVLVVLPLLVLSVVSFQRARVWRDSVTLWEDATAKVPVSDRAWQLLGEAYFSAGKKKEAIQSYERGFTLNPSNTEVLWALGDMYTEAGELDKGYGFLKKLLEINPSYVIGLASLGNNYLQRGEYAEAEKAYKRALDVQPEALQVDVMLGDLAVVQGRLDLARDYYRLVEAAWQTDPGIAYKMACVESLAGRLNEALTWLEKALQRGFQDYGKMEGDKQLSAIRNEARFNDLVQRYLPRNMGGAQ